MSPRSRILIQRLSVPLGLLWVTWLVAFAWRPLMLGFYDDDWISLLLRTRDYGPLSWDRFASFMHHYLNRPCIGVTTYLMSLVGGESAVAWHLAVAGLSLGAAICLRSMLRALLALLDVRDRWPADLGAAIWLAFPWMLGTTAWPTLTPTLVAMMGFALAATVLFRAWRRGRSPWLAPATLLLVGLLTYESFYGQLVCLLLIGLVLGVPRRVGWRSFATTAGALMVVQVAAVVWNRASATINPSMPNKSFNPDWPLRLVDNVLRLPRAVHYPLEGLSPVPEFLLAAVLLGGATLLLIRLRRRDERSRARHSLGVLLVAGVGVVLGCAVLAGAGYGVSGLGPESRTTQVFSFWLAVAWTVTLSAAVTAHRGLRYGCTGVAVASIGLLAIAGYLRGRVWSEVWDIQRATLARVAVSELEQARDGAAVLLIGPHRHKRVTTFPYHWVVSGAMHYTYPSLSHLTFYPAREDWQTRWDGQRVEQRRRDGHVLNIHDTDEVWFWVGETGAVYAAEAPFTHPRSSAVRPADAANGGGQPAGARAADSGPRFSAAPAPDDLVNHRGN